VGGLRRAGRGNWRRRAGGIFLSACLRNAQSPVG
jgi:hypothetical protein